MARAVVKLLLSGEPLLGDGTIVQENRMASGLASWGRFFSVVASAFGHFDLLDFGLVSVTYLALQSLEHW